MSATAAHRDTGSGGIKPRLHCPCCGESGPRTIYRVSGIPVHSCILLASAEEARSYPRRDLELAFCERCGFLFNRLFDESVMAYSAQFEESQHFSGTFNAFARRLAADIATRYGIAGKLIMDIGCGKGEFLIHLCEVAGARGLGIDPAYRPDEGRNVKPSVRFVQERFAPHHARLSPDMVLCRHTLEHIAAVGDFVHSIRETVGHRQGVPVVFETPDAKRVLDEAAFWDIYYEHCSYFSAGTHARLFRMNQFDVDRLELVYDGQYIVQYARPSSAPTAARLRLEDDLADLKRSAEAFPRRVAQAQEAWRSCLRDAHAAGRRIVLWGGASKAVSFVTTLGLTSEIEAAVDINPYKQGKFLPGSGHPVIAPESLCASPPDIVIVMNPIYRKEVEARLQGLRLRPRVFGILRPSDLLAAA